MSTKKYYTPKIEEFHRGFRLEIFNDKDKPCFSQRPTGEWLDVVVGSTILGDLHKIQRLLSDGQVRVKHLDDEDIESLGWNLGLIKNGVSYFFIGSHILILDSKSNKVALTEQIGGLEIGEEKPTNYLFNGRVKNKSELKRLMAQCEIEA